MISVTILVKNGERTLRKVLQSTTSFQEVILIDTGSTDGTLNIAKEFSNVKIYNQEFTAFGPMRNGAATLATNDWILALDADEVLSPGLVKEILNHSLDCKTLYAFPRHNYLNDKWIRCAGWYPEKQIRLYNKRESLFSDAMVHEGIIKKNKKIHLFTNPISHYPYLCISDFLKKMELYSTLFAKDHQYKKRSSPLIAVLHGSFAFFKSYILKWGILGGYEGFLISLYNGHTAFYKYLKLYHLNQEC